MRLKILGSSSEGNCYVFHPLSEPPLIIECGVNFEKVKEELNFKLSNISALVSHFHSDHFKYADKFLNAGIQLYALKETFEHYGLDKHHRAVKIEPEKQFKIGGFTIKPFSVMHDVPCLGFLIHHKECGITLFITDTFYVPNTFSGLNNILIEANYCNKIIKEKLSDKEFLKNRVLTSHMSLQTCLGFFSANDLSSVNNIVLLHLSNSNSHEGMFKKEVENATGKTVTVAYNGLEMELNKTPF